MKTESTARSPSPGATAPQTAQPIDLRTSAQEFFAVAQWAGPPLDLATETAASILAWLK
jgi:hypothetical protein